MPEGVNRGNAGKGRPKGAKNKSTLEVAKIAGQLVDDPAYRKSLAQRLRDGKLPPAVETMLWHYRYGKPKETLKVEQDQPFRLEHAGTDELLARLQKLTQALSR